MNMEVYNLDSLRKLVRELQKENHELKRQLEQNHIPYERNDVFQDSSFRMEEYDLDQGARIDSKYIDDNLARKFYSMFWGREDVYAKRAKNGNYYPQCENRWNDKLCPKQRKEKVACGECPNTKWSKLQVKQIVSHLIGYRDDGADVIGIYPLLPDGTSRLLVFDFDNHEKDAQRNDFANEGDDWHEEVDALRLICKQNGIEPLVERSRSGRGAHVWILFQKPIAAELIRSFAFLLLDKGTASINLKTFQYYDRMYPTQDTANSIGNLVALPLQGQALKEGNSAFVDENWNVYPNQWEYLFETKKLSEKEVVSCIAKWKEDLGILPTSTTQKRLKPWKRDNRFAKEDVVGELHIVLADGVYVDALNIKPRLQNQIRCLAAFDNPIYYKNHRMGYSNYYNFSTIYLGRDIDGYIKVPRGLTEKILEECKASDIKYNVDDQREKGMPICVEFSGELREQQDVAAEKLLSFDHGILSAATAFGKTVICSYLIARRKVNTLILLESTDLMLQWKEELTKFLDIDEEPPEYKTKTGRIKKRDSVVGTLVGGKDKLTGIIDIAMVGSLYKKGNFHEKINSYGMVIMDECHHAASSTAQEILKKVNARYVYGVSATPIRSDKLEKINYMLLGSIRHTYSTKEKNQAQSMEHYVIPRYTRVVDFTGESDKSINKAYELISNSEVRNKLIIEDVRKSVQNGYTPVILTRFKSQAKYLFDHLKNEADDVYLLYGDNTAKENEKVRKQLKEVVKDKSLILIATGQKIGEGFDFPRLDTLMLAAPISYEGRVEQYVGRLNRDYEGKEAVFVYDYIDSKIDKFEKMYRKRLRAYKKIGFEVKTDCIDNKQNVGAIYDEENYVDIFERDLVEANSEILIASPGIVKEKIKRFIYLVKTRQEAGVSIVVVTQNPDDTKFDRPELLHIIINELHSAGIRVLFTERETEHFAIIDKKIVWHGGMNLLGKQDAWDNLIRVEDVEIAAELMEMVK